ncbi:hypothetical protein EVAR_99306_1 [Eumeta japonica]|uniref:Uncharacterized protein n=1 Tax=Eumeta variegata TaxID=151549 RepID=A0A4C1YYB7_EUMVA|nr:hypothetical protein EVAR_99306_1 [Eumeta japonica]
MTYDPGPPATNEGLGSWPVVGPSGMRPCHDTTSNLWTCPIPTQETTHALVTLLGLRVFMGSDDLCRSGSQSAEIFLPREQNGAPTNGNYVNIRPNRDSNPRYVANMPAQWSVMRLSAQIFFSDKTSIGSRINKRHARLSSK